MRTPPLQGWGACRRPARCLHWFRFDGHSLCGRHTRNHAASLDKYEINRRRCSVCTARLAKMKGERPMKPDSTIYFGSRTRTGAHVTRTDEDGSVRVLDPAASMKVRSHSDTGFEWGYGGAGPAQLALGILLDFTDDAARAFELHQHFKWDVIFRLPAAASFALSGAEIREWLETRGAAVTAELKVAAGSRIGAKP